jgi:hypothetical protein
VVEVGLSVDRKLVKRFGAIIMVVNIAVAFFSFTDMYLLASGAIQVEYPDQGDFETSFDVLKMEFVFKSQYTVTNDGFYNVDDMDIRSKLWTEGGDLLISYDSTDLMVPRWSTRTFEIEARLPIENLLKVDMEEILFEDGSFELWVTIGADYVMGLVHFGLDQVQEFQWDAPLEDYEGILEDMNLSAMIEDLLGGDFEGASDKIAAAVYGALLASGEEATVPLNEFTDLVVYVEGETIHVKVVLTAPFPITLVHFEMPVDDVAQEGGEDDSG